MRQIKNVATGEVVKISNVMDNGEGKLIGRYEFGKRFFSKYTMCTEDGITEDGKPIIRLAEGWEIVGCGRTMKPRAKKQDTPETHEDEVVKKEEVKAPTTTQQPTIPQQSEVVNAFAALTPLFAGVEANVTAAIMAKVQPILDRAPREVVHTIVVGGEKREDMKGEVFHPNFDAVCNRIARGMWVYLYGPTGSGKNVMAEQIARALGLDFYYQAHTLDRFELTGFIDASGKYQETEFYKAYTRGGLFMLDELDASDENALITLNSACNGYFAFPCGTVQAHPDFRVIAAGNTCGRGATEDYTARRVLDASSLGRFIPRYHGYCREIDMAAARGNEELVTFFNLLRKVKEETGVQMLLSPRQIKNVADLEDTEVLSELLRDVLTSYMTQDDINIVKDKLSGTGKYQKAFKNI